MTSLLLTITADLLDHARSEVGQLALAHAVDPAQQRQRRRLGSRQLPQGCIAEDHIGRDPPLAGQLPAHLAEVLERTRLVVGPRAWSALYQQQPAPEDGNYFKREWIEYYDDPPPRERLKLYGASDYAVTDRGGDFTVHGVIGVDPEDNIYLFDWWREQTASVS